MAIVSTSFALFGWDSFFLTTSYITFQGGDLSEDDINYKKVSNREQRVKQAFECGWARAFTWHPIEI